MGTGSPDSRDLQAQLDDLLRQVSANHATIVDLVRRADASEVAANADRDMIAELQEAGVIGREREAQLQDALKSSRTIGAAIGLIMGSRHVSEDEAFTVLRLASQNSNRKLRELAAELVASAGLIDPSR